MSKERSAPLGGEAPQEPQKPNPGLPPKQLHDPGSPENLLRSGRPLSAKDLQGPALSADEDAELRAAEDRLIREKMDQDQADAPSTGYPPQPEEGAPDRVPATTSLPDGGGNKLEARTLPIARRNLELYSPPPVPITDNDLERMLECIIHNKHYSERFKKGPVEILFRVKSAKEVDFQRANLSKMAKDGEFGLQSDFQAAVARFNQLFQTVSYNGKEVPPVKIPPRPWKKEDLNLEKQYWTSWLSEVTESANYMIHGMMVQFEDKVYTMQQRMLDPDFTMPAAPSSSARD